MPDPDPWYRFRISGILRRGARSVECLVQNLMFIWCNRMEETSQSNEIDYTSAFTSNNTEGTGNMSQSNEVDFTSASTSNNTEGTAETSQSDEMDHTSASTSNNAEGTSPKNTEHEFSPAKEVTEALCTEPYNEAWMNNIDERFLKPFKDGQRRPCPHHWSMLFEYETLQVHDELAFKFFPGGDIGVPSQEAEYFACVSQVTLRLLAFHGDFLIRSLFCRSLDSKVVQKLYFSTRAGATQSQSLGDFALLQVFSES